MIEYSRRFLVFFAMIFLSGAAVAEEKEIPTEPGKAPFAEGDLLGEGGMDQAIGDGITMNFRLVDGRIRIYFVDENRLIVEPPFETGMVRFDRRDIKRGRLLYSVARMEKDLGLGTEDRRLVPFIALTFVTLHATEERPEKILSFIYNTQAMDPAPVDEESSDG